jgi:hypothetical protein
MQDEGAVLDMTTPASAGRLGRLFNTDTPEKTFKEFWEFCCQYRSIYTYHFAIL